MNSRQQLAAGYSRSECVVHGRMGGPDASRRAMTMWVWERLRLRAGLGLGGDEAAGFAGAA